MTEFGNVCWKRTLYVKVDKKNVLKFSRNNDVNGIRGRQRSPATRTLLRHHERPLVHQRMKTLRDAHVLLVRDDMQCAAFEPNLLKGKTLRKDVNGSLIECYGKFQTQRIL